MLEEMQHIPVVFLDPIVMQQEMQQEFLFQKVNIMILIYMEMMKQIIVEKF